MRLSPSIKGILFSAAGFTSWALGDAIIKYLTGFYTIYAIVFYGAVTVSVFFTMASPWMGGLRQTFASKKLKWHLLRGVLFFIQMVMVIYGFSQMTMAKTYAIVFSAPFMTAILSVFLLKEKICPRQWLAILTGFAGILIILRPGMVPLDAPVLSVLGGAFIFSLANIAVRFIEKPGEHTETMLSWGLLPELVVTLCSGALFIPDFVFPAAVHLPLIGLMALSSATGMTLIALAFRAAAPATVAPFHYVQMLWGVILGYLVFGDVLDFWVGVGAAVVIGSGLWLIWQERNNAKVLPQVAVSPS